MSKSLENKEPKVILKQNFEWLKELPKDKQREFKRCLVLDRGAIDAQYYLNKVGTKGRFYSAAFPFFICKSDSLFHYFRNKMRNEYPI